MHSMNAPTDPQACAQRRGLGYKSQVFDLLRKGRHEDLKRLLGQLKDAGLKIQMLDIIGSAAVATEAKVRDQLPGLLRLLGETGMRFKADARFESLQAGLIPNDQLLLRALAEPRPEARAAAAPATRGA
jgi:hypothetical protein